MRFSAILSAALSVLPVLVPLAQAQETASQHDDVQATIATFKKKDPGIQKFFDDAVGIAVLPTVAKGAIGIGGAHGTGELLVGGKAIGKISMTQVTIGLQLGGQAYSEIILLSESEHARRFQEQRLCLRGASHCGRARIRRVRQRRVSKRRGRLHVGQGRLDVRGQYRRPEVFLQALLTGPRQRLVSLEHPLGSERRRAMGRQVCGDGGHEHQERRCAKQHDRVQRIHAEDH